MWHTSGGAASARSVSLGARVCVLAAVAAIVVMHVLCICRWLTGATDAAVTKRGSRAIRDRAAALGHANGLDSRVALVTLMKDPPDVVTWLSHHRRMGVSRFFVRLEDDRGGVLAAFLAQQPDVTVFESGASGVSENYTGLIDRQRDFVTAVLSEIRRHNGAETAAAAPPGSPLGIITWLFHIDADELLYVNTERHRSIAHALDATVPLHVKTLKLTNVEAVYAAPDVARGQCFSATRFLRCDRGASCRSYVNGKAGARVDDDPENIRFHGPHDFLYTSSGTTGGDTDGGSSLHGTGGLLTARPQPATGQHAWVVPFEALGVLHFDSCTLTAWFNKFHNLAKGSSAVKGIPFPYYRDSISAVRDAVAVFERYKMRSAGDTDTETELSIPALAGPACVST